jgi:hypothetical protein
MSKEPGKEMDRLQYPLCLDFGKGGPHGRLSLPQEDRKMGTEKPEERIGLI